MIQSTSAAAAKSYFDDGFAKGDYYSDGQEIAGQWAGRGAARLGLTGTVERAAFAALCENRHPVTGARLTARNAAQRTVGYDLNFHCPKSLSALYELTGDERLKEAFQAAVTDTMTELEADMKTRVRKGGVQEEERTTGNLVYGLFVHRTSRPSQMTGLPDPHLHAHCFVFNATFDDTEGQWKAGQFRGLKHDAPYYEAAFHARLAQRTARLGYGITRREKFWDITGVPASVLEKFSWRTAEIEAEARARGITNAQTKDRLGAQTRAAKQKGLGLDELRREWAARLTPDEWDAMLKAAHGGEGGQGGNGFDNDLTPQAAMDYALAHLLERQSVAGLRQVQEAALRYGVGRVSVEGVQRESLRPDLLQRDCEGQRMVTTRQVLAEEKALLDTVRAGRGQYPPLGKRAFTFGADVKLNEQQQAAVRHVLTSCDAVLGISGGAGVGKTTLMREAVRGIEEGGKKVFTFAPTADASRGVLRAEGFASADTVAALLSDAQLQTDIQGQVLWIDEAGLLGAAQLRQVMELARRQNARIILSGDAGQHHAVQRGDVLRLLETHAGLACARVCEIQRQKGVYKNAVAAFSRGDLAEGFAGLEALHAVVELADEAQRYQRLAGEYADALKRGKTVLAVAPTHAEGRQVTRAVREALRQAGQLATHEREFSRLENLQWTQAQRGDAIRYRPGMVVQFMQKAQGFARGERAVVISAVDKAVVVRDAHGRTRALPLHQAERFQVYRAESLALAIGEKIRLTQNGFTRPAAGVDQGHRLNNGALYDLKGFTADGDLELHNGWIVRRDYGHLDYGYCSTSQSAQGKTVDVVLLAQAAASLPAASREQFYVSVSRGRETVRIFTDDARALKEAVAGSAARQSATDLCEQGQPVPASAARQVRQRADWLRLLASYARKQAAQFAAEVQGAVWRSAGPVSRTAPRTASWGWE